MDFCICHSSVTSFLVGVFKHLSCFVCGLCHIALLVGVTIACGLSYKRAAFDDTFRRPDENRPRKLFLKTRGARAGNDANAAIFNNFHVPTKRGTSLGQSWDKKHPAPRRWYTGTKCLNRRRAEDDRPETGDERSETGRGRQTILRSFKADQCCFVLFRVVS